MSLGASYLTMRERFEGSDVYSDFSEPRIDRVTANLDVSVLGRSGWLAQARVPIGWLRHDGDVGQPPVTLSGLGDVALSGGWRWLFGKRVELTSLATVKMPTGQVTTAGVLSSTSMPTVVAIGNGTWSVGSRFALNWRVTESYGLRIPLRLNLPLTHAVNGAKPGLGLRSGVEGFYIHPKGHVFSGGLNVGWRAQARFDSHGQILNSGGTLVAVQLATLLMFSDAWGAQLAGRVPLWRTVGGRQLSEWFSASAAVVYRGSLL